MASLFDVFGRLLLEDGGKQFIADSAKAGGKAGDAAGQSMGQRVSRGLKSAIGGGARVVAGAASAAFAIAAKGALAMEDATARYRAETGATAEEAERAAKAANRTAGDQRVALEGVIDVATRVRKDLGAVGEQADQLTDDFVRFARVTKQDAAGAVSDFDDIVDGYGLTLEQVRDVQDKLVVSNQKYGGSITDNQKALAAMAPQLKALNLQYDDGIGLLNLFAASGLDASAGQKALNAAIKKLPPGETLQQFLERLSKVQNDGERATLAMQVFGTRAGAGLANAIKPGVGSLDDFKISADGAAGATGRAADALDSTFTAQLQRKISQAGAALRQLGADFGPVVTGAASLASLGGGLGLDKALGKLLTKLGVSSLVKAGATRAGALVGAVFSGAMFAGDKLGGALGGALDKLPGSALLKRGTGGLGKVLGSSLGKLAAAGFAAVMVVEVFETYNRIKGELKSQTDQIGAAVGKQIVSGTTDELTRSRAGIQHGLDELNKTIDLGIFTNDTRKTLQERAAAIDAELARRAAAIPQDAGAAIAAGEPAVTAGAATAMSGVGDEVEEAADEAGAAAANVPVKIAAGILEQQGAVGVAMAALTNQIENEKTPAQQASYDIGTLVGSTLSKALLDKRPGVREAAGDVRDVAEAELAKFIANGGTIGKKAMAELVRAEHSKDPAVREQAHRTRAIIEKGIIPNSNAAVTAAYNLGTRAVRALKKGWGTPNLRANIILGNSGFQGGARAKGGPVDPREMYRVGEHGEEWFVPDVPGTILPHGTPPPAATVQPQVAGDTFQLNVPVTGLPMEARTPRDIVRELQRVGDVGLLARRRRRRFAPVRS